MELQLENIGMIEEANVEINGLTVIAGENDTGKSTLSKILYCFIEAINLSQYNEIRQKHSSKLCDTFNFYVEKIFNGKITDNGSIEVPIVEEDEYIFLLEIKDNQCNDFSTPPIEVLENLNYNTIMVETPLVWNFTDFFRDIAQIESQMRIELDYPYLMKDLNFKLHIKNASNGLDIKKEVTDLMGGEFKKDEMGKYYFNKNGQRIELVNTATGIKYFGIFQVLSQHNYLNKNTILILDEPEVHLHPKWQLEMAKIIVELVKNGVKIVVNSHSPYMLEALQRYSEVEKIEDKTNFYLAEDGIIDKVEESNALTLEKIFGKLSEPFDVFDEMDSRILRGE